MKAVALIAGLSIALQSAQIPPMAFEVASIKPNNYGDRNSAVMPQPGGGLSATNVTLVQLMRFGFQIQGFQISGLPGWANSLRFDIAAKAAADAQYPPGAWQSMLQTLLADRFKLSFHREQRPMAIFELAISRNGHKLQQASPDNCKISYCSGLPTPNSRSNSTRRRRTARDHPFSLQCRSNWVCACKRRKHPLKSWSSITWRDRPGISLEIHLLEGSRQEELWTRRQFNAKRRRPISTFQQPPFRPAILLVISGESLRKIASRS